MKETKVNSDGFFVRYQIQNDADSLLNQFGIQGASPEDSSIIGQIDYYYSWEDNTFSYRQFVLPFLNDLGNGDNILIYELQNVPVDEANKGFKAGFVYNDDKNRSYFKFLDIMLSNDGIDFQNPGTQHPERVYYVELMSHDMIMKFMNSTSVSFGTNAVANESPFDGTYNPFCYGKYVRDVLNKNPAAIVDSENNNIASTYPLSSLALANTDLNDILLEAGYGAVLPGTTGYYTRPDVKDPANTKINLEFGRKVINFFINDAFSTEASTFTSKEEFNKKKLEFNDTYASAITEKKSLLAPIVFDLNEETFGGATITQQTVSLTRDAYDSARPGEDSHNHLAMHKDGDNSTFYTYNANHGSEFPANNVADFGLEFAKALFKFAQIPDAGQESLFEYYELNK